jgi:hypothetical protein
MKPGVVIDTNVPIVANGGAPQADAACQLACIRKLETIRRSHRVFLDRSGLILGEYRLYLSPRGQPNVGDAFFKWLWDNQANEEVCHQVTITPIDDSHRAFLEFPEDPLLVTFDRSDQKFVAVVVSSAEQVPIVNATDTDWWDVRAALARHGVTIEFVCIDLMIR